jgi:hypothetical protein
MRYSRKTMAKKKIDPEVRAVLEEIRRDVRELIALIQARLNEKRA